MTIMEFTKKLDQVYTIPRVALKVIQQITNIDVNIGNLAKLIGTDQALTSDILKVANSSFFNFSEQILTIKKAIIVMGLDLTKQITASFAVKSLMAGMSSISNSGYGNIWKDSAYNGIFASKIANHVGYDGNILFVAGLLQDLGIIIEIMYDSESTEKIFKIMQKDKLSYAEAEKKVWEHDHAELGCYALREWKIPMDITIPVKYHHNINNIAPEHLEYESGILIVYLATLVTNVYLHQSNLHRLLITEDIVGKLGMTVESFWDLLDEIFDSIQQEEEFISMIL